MRTDAELLEAWRTGDGGAGHELFERHVGSVSRFLRNKVDDTQREDLLQRTFLSCVEARDRLRHGTSFKAYLLTAARNKLYDHYRQRTHFDPLLSSIEDLDGSPSAIVAQQQRDQLLLSALRRLPLGLQIALELHYWEGMSTADIGRVLGVPQGTAKTRLFRARELLREHLAALLRSSPIEAPSVENLERWAASMRGVVDER